MFCWLAVGWAAAMMRPSGPARIDATEDQAHAEMRAAGQGFGRSALEAIYAADEALETDPRGASLVVSDYIRERAARWSDYLRSEGLNVRLAEHLVTTWVLAAHEASNELLHKALLETRH